VVKATLLEKIKIQIAGIEKQAQVAVTIEVSAIGGGNYRTVVLVYPLKSRHATSPLPRPFQLVDRIGWPWLEGHGAEQ
jgi:hypothetical protein